MSQHFVFMVYLTFNFVQRKPSEVTLVHCNWNVLSVFIRASIHPSAARRAMKTKSLVAC